MKQENPYTATASLSGSVESEADTPQYRVGQSVQHKIRELSCATFAGWSKSGKRIGIKHNCLHPWGVHMVVDYFSPDSILPFGIKDSISSETIEIDHSAKEKSSHE